MRINDVIEALYEIHYLIDPKVGLTQEEKDRFTAETLNRVYYDPIRVRSEKALKKLESLVDTIAKEYIQRVVLPENTPWHSIVHEREELISQFADRITVTHESDKETLKAQISYSRINRGDHEFLHLAFEQLAHELAKAIDERKGANDSGR